MVLANAEKLSDKVQEIIRAFVESGGGLVMTYRTGFRDRDGDPRARPGLAALAGVTGLHGEIINPSPEAFVPRGTSLPQTYYRVSCEEPEWTSTGGRLLSFRAPYVEMEAASEAVQIAQVIDFDYSRMHPDHSVIGWYPWEAVRPLIVGKQAGKGRAVYIAAELDGAALRFADTDTLAVLAAAVRWASGGSPELLRTTLPPSVEITVHRSPHGRRWLLVLTNQGTNQHYPDPVRYVLPVKDVEVALRVGPQRVTEVRAVSGQLVSWRHSDGFLTISFGCLPAYEALLIDLE